MKDLNSNLPLAGKTFKPLVATSLALALGVSVLSAQSISTGGTTSIGTETVSSGSVGVNFAGVNNVAITSKAAIITKGEKANSPFSALFITDSANVAFAADAGKLTLSGLTAGDYVINNNGVFDLNSGTTIVAGTGKGGQISSDVAGLKFAFGSSTAKYTLIGKATAGSAAGADITGVALSADTTLSGNLAIQGQAGAQDKNGGAATGLVVTSNGTDALTLTIGDDAQGATSNNFSLVVQGGDGGNVSASATNGGNATGLSFQGTAGGTNNAIKLVSINDKQSVINLGVMAGSGQDKTTNGTTTAGKNGTTTAILNAVNLSLDNVAIQIAGLANGAIALDNNATLNINAANSGIIASGNQAFPNYVANTAISNSAVGAVFNLGTTNVSTLPAASGVGSAIIGMDLQADTTLSGTLNVTGQNGSTGNAGGAATGIKVSSGTPTLTLVDDLTLNVTGGSGTTRGNATALNVALGASATLETSGNFALVMTGAGSTFKAIDNQGILTIDNVNLIAGESLANANASVALLSNAQDVQYNFGTNTAINFSQDSLSVGMLINKDATFGGSLTQKITAGKSSDVYAIVAGKRSSASNDIFSDLPPITLTLDANSVTTITASSALASNAAVGTAKGDAYGIYAQDNFTIASNNGVGTAGKATINLVGNDVTAIKLVGSAIESIPLKVELNQIAFDSLNADSNLTLIKNSGFSSLTLNNVTFGANSGKLTTGKDGVLNIIDNTGANLTLSGTMQVGSAITNISGAKVAISHNFAGGNYIFGSGDFGTTITAIDGGSAQVYGFAIASDTAIQGNLTFDGIASSSNSDIYGTYVSSALTLNDVTNLTYNNLASSNNEAYGLYLTSANASLSGEALNVSANGSGKVSAFGLDNTTFANYNSLTLSASSSSSDASAITTTNTVNIATDIRVTDVSAVNGTAYVLNNKSGNLTFAANSSSSSAKLNVYAASDSILPLGSKSTEYAIYQNGVNAGYAFGTSTSFGAISGHTQQGVDGQQAVWMMLGGQTTFSGTATIASVNGGNGSIAYNAGTGESAEGWCATNGGDAYGIASLNDQASIIFNAANSTITFNAINAGAAGYGIDDKGNIVTNTSEGEQAIAGNAAGLYVQENSTLSISSDDSKSGAGKIVFSAIGASNDGETYIIKNAGTLNLAGNTQIIAGSSGNASMIYNNIADSVYDFGTLGTSLTLSNAAVTTGVNLAQSATLQGTLKVQGGSGDSSNHISKALVIAANQTLNNNSLTIKAQAGSENNFIGIAVDSGSASINLNGELNADISGGNATTTSGISVASSGTLNVTNGTLRINVTAGDKTGDISEGAAYIINNEGTLNFDETASLVASSSLPTNLDYSFGLYSNTKAGYKFGTTNFTVNGAAEKGGNAVGIVLAQSTSFEGNLTQTITGGTGSGTNNGGNATGLLVDGKNSTLTLASGATTLNVAGGVALGSGQNGNATGIQVTNGRFAVSGSGTLTLNIGNQTTTKAIGLALNNSVFNGNITFGSVQSTGVASGLSVTGGSVLNSGTLTFQNAAFSANNTFNVIDNTGVLTITKDAKIVAGSGSATGNVGINNAIDNAVYNLGNLNLDVAAGASGATAIYSSKATAQFNVAAGSTLNLSVVGMGGNSTNPNEYFGNSAIFGGSVNLNLASGAASNVYLNANGGTLASLKAAENTTIYLSGKDKATRVGLSDTIQYRSLTINAMQSAYVDPTSLALDANKIYSGANFVVLASREKASKGGNSDGFIGNAYDANGNRYYPSTTVGNTTIPASYNLGGSDRIIIKDGVAGDGMPRMSRINNTLSIGLSDISESKEQKYVILAQVSNDWTPILGGGADRLHNVVTFNGLTSDGASTLVQSNVGFDVATLEIQRHDLGTEEQLNLSATNNGEDWSNVGAVYFSDLVARDIKVDQDYADSSTAAITTNYNLISANLNSLSKRMGELRNTDNTQGVWGRIFAGQQTSEFGIEQTSTYTTFQAGYDYKFSLEDASNYAGVAVSYVYGMSKQASASYFADASATTRVTGNASSTTNGVEVALYNSYVSDSGLYSDSILKFGYFASDLNIPAQSDTYKTHNTSVSISEEIGYRIKFGGSSEWFIDPQAELAYAFINSSDFTQTLGDGSTLLTEQDATSMLRTRVGAAWGYNFDHLSKNKEVKAALYVGTYYAYDYIAGGEVHLTTNNGTQGNYDSMKSNGRFVLNVGTDVAFKDNAKVYVDFEKSFGGSMRTDYQLSLGVRYSFGSKSAAAPADADKEESSTSASLKPKSLDESK